MSKMFSLTEDGYILSNEQLHVVDFINMTLSAQMQMFKRILQEAPKEQHTKLKEELYDTYNHAASAFLKAFAPEIELRPDLTEAAILKAENEILDQVPGQIHIDKVLQFPKGEQGE